MRVSVCVCVCAAVADSSPCKRFSRLRCSCMFFRVRIAAGACFCVYERVRRDVATLACFRAVLPRVACTTGSTAARARDVATWRVFELCVAACRVHD